MVLKKNIKKCLPDRAIYLWQVIRRYPQYRKLKKEYKHVSYPKIKMLTDRETIDQIVNSRRSLARFGDGEFMWMLGIELKSYQSYSIDLQKKLIKAITSTNPNLLIGIPGGLFDSSRCNVFARMGWDITRYEFLPKIEKFFDTDKVYCDASISRPYIDYKRNVDAGPKFENLKRIWNGRDVVIVEGEKTRLGVGNNLLDNAKSIRRILCPATNAFDKLQDIEKAILQHAAKDDLVLAALGPTATILAYDMCEKGYQTVDIGHVDVEYVWYLNHAILREPIEGKYVNESGVIDHSNIFDDNPKYVASVIARII